MALFTQAEFEARFEDTLNAEETARFNEVLTFVDGHVATYVRGRYGWPLDPNPPEIVSAALDIFRDEIIVKSNRKPTTTVTKRREMAEAFLLRIARGQAALDTGETSDDAISNFTVATEPEIFTKTLLDQMP